LIIPLVVIAVAITSVRAVDIRARGPGGYSTGLASRLSTCFSDTGFDVRPDSRALSLDRPRCDRWTLSAAVVAARLFAGCARSAAAEGAVGYSDQ
jgi:hypothetical protein